MNSGWLADGRFAVEMESTLAYDFGTRQWMPTEAKPLRSRWLAAQDGGAPTACGGDYTRLADVRGASARPNPIRSWGFLPDCSLHVVHDGKLWLIDNDRRATSLGAVSWSVRPVVFVARPFDV